MDVGYTKLPASHSKHHSYETKIVMKNVSNVIIPDYVTVLSFPKFFIAEGGIPTHDRSQATATHLVFQFANNTGRPLMPGQERQILKVRYQMNNDLAARYGAFRGDGARAGVRR